LTKTVLAIGLSLPSMDGFEASDLTFNRSMLDADIIIVEPNFSDFSTYESYNGRPKMTAHSSSEWLQLQARWVPNLRNALAAGKTVIFLIPELEEYYYYTGKQENTGTPGRPVMTSYVDSCKNHDLLPVNLAGAIYGFGTSMALTSESELIAGYWKKFENDSNYNCHFEIDGAVPLVVTRSGKKQVGVHLKKYGNLIYLPGLTWDFPAEEGGWSKESKAYVRTLRDALFDIDEKLRKDTESTPVPAWAGATEFRFSREAEVEAEILAIEERTAKLVQKREELAASLLPESELRGLLYEGGHPLENAVRAALKILGFKTDNFKSGDSEFDAVFESDEGRFLGEVEGKDNKQINVDKISQLHRNLTEDLKRDEVTCPALPVLFGNAFRGKHPKERTEYFTAKVVSFAKTSNTALIMTPDLFTAAQYVRESADHEFAAACRVAIKAGAGGLVKFPDAPQKEIRTDAQ
jgi:hypothetical protein